MQARGPRPWRTQAERQILQAARYYIILSAGHQRRHCFLDQPQWESTRCLPEGATPDKYDILYDIFAQPPGIIEDYDNIRTSDVVDLVVVEVLRQRTQSLIDRLHAWYREMPWICTTDPAMRENSGNPLPDDPMECVALAISYAMILCLVQPCEYLGIELIPKDNSGTSSDADYNSRHKFLALEICRFANWALRGEDSASYALLLVYPLQIAWFSPNFQYKLSGPIQIGNIIADPFQPARVLSSLREDKAPDIESITEHDHELAREQGRSIGISFWAQFLQCIGANVDMNQSKDILREYNIAELETRYLRNEPLDDDVELTQRLAEPRVQSAIQAGLFGRQPVYMITGLKIARGLSVRTASNKAIGGGVGSTVPVTESVSIGGGMTSERRSGISDSFTGGEEAIIFAYQLHKITYRVRKQSFNTSIFESKAAFLHDEDETTDDSEGFSVDMATIQGLETYGMSLETHELVDDGGAHYTCISAKDAL
ncbi:hypothetical protein IL306_000595 [Fusarium sp. DS 682]|nr:hypothetical protein IL306_000595 [Fusarium sp. DS 682]